MCGEALSLSMRQIAHSVGGVVVPCSFGKSKALLLGEEFDQ